MKIKSFQDLEVWQLGLQVVNAVYAVTATFPDHEQYALRTQLQRAAVSVPSNIAEGFNRYYDNEYRRFLYIALGSCGELETQVEIAASMSYISQEQKQDILMLLRLEARKINTLIRKIGEKISNGS